MKPSTASLQFASGVSSAAQTREAVRQALDDMDTQFGRPSQVDLAVTVGLGPDEVVVREAATVLGPSLPEAGSWTVVVKC